VFYVSNLKIYPPPPQKKKNIQARERITDVSAVYIVQPTLANCQLIAKDVAAGLYDSIHLNFISPLPRPLFEKLAKDVADGGNAHIIARVFDQFLAFVSLEHNVFSLNLPDSFAGYNSAKAKDSDVELALTKAADGLVCAVVTMGRIPILRCAKVSCVFFRAPFLFPPSAPHDVHC